MSRLRSTSSLRPPLGKLACFALLVLGAWGCPDRPGQIDPRAELAVSVTDAESGELVFTLDRAAVAQALARARLEVDRDAPPLEPAAKRALLERLIEERLLARDAHAAGVHASTVAVAAEMAEIAAELGEARGPALDRVYRSEADLEAAIAARLTAEAFILRRTRTATPTEGAIRAAFAALDEDARRRPARVHASQIVVSTDKEAVAAAKRLKKGEDFASLARELSIAPEADIGGDLGWFEASTMPPVFATTCFSLEPGETSPVVASTYGYHLFRVHAKKPAEVATYAELRAELAARLHEEATARAERALLAGLKDGLTVTLHPEVLHSLGVDLTDIDEPAP